MKAILIEPNKHPVVVDKEWTYEEIRDFVGGTIESVPHYLPNLSLYAHDEAKYAGPDGRPLPFNAIASIICSPRLHNGDWIGGNVIVLGFNPEDGENAELAEWVEPLVELVKQVAIEEQILNLIP